MDMDELDETVDDAYYRRRAESSCGQVTVLWTGIQGEENLLVYNNRTRKTIYEEHPPIGMDANYDVEQCAKEFASGTFVSDGERRCTSYPAGTYGPDGLIHR
jgi:hypothetical protein